jgi:hypothetical protein
MELQHLTEERPVYRLTGAQREALRASFAGHLQTAGTMGGVRLTAALPCQSEGAAPVADTPRRPSRFMPAPDQTGFHGLTVEKRKPSLWTRLSAWLKTNMA